LIDIPMAILLAVSLTLNFILFGEWDKERGKRKNGEAGDD